MKKGILLAVSVFALMMIISVVPMSATPLIATSNSVSSIHDMTSQAQSWTLGPPAPFQYRRFDGVFVSGADTWANKVYFLGGRTGVSTEDPTIWQFDPVTGIYTDTGADVVESVSNYTANLVMDDGTGQGPAIYIIGGFDAEHNVMIGTIQRYYPQINLAEALPPADDWSVLVAGNLVSAMGNATVDNVIYVFGGWENVVPPYFYNGTWVFDPSQPTGAKWTELPYTINPARNYIQVAIQGGIIYAMGGAYIWNGSVLTPTAIVEAFDTANPGAGWVPRAPMPVAISDGRGFGFDADTKGINQPWLGRAYVVGGSLQPPGPPSADVMEYLIGSDSWDQGFPDLINARYDFAGVFVPICTPDPNDGLPGMWAFGGRMTSDLPPYAPTEYYPMSCEESPQVTLRPSYQEGTAMPGDTAVYSLTLTNQIGSEDIFNLEYSAVYTITGPATIGPVPNGSSVGFQVQVTVPSDANCFDADTGTVTTTAISAPEFSDTALIKTSSAPAGIGSLEGYIFDANTDLGIENAYLRIYLGDMFTYSDTYTGPDGSYSIANINACIYNGLSTAFGYFNQVGSGINVPVGEIITHNVYLDASWPVLTGAPVSVLIPPESTSTYTLSLANEGTGDLNFHITEVPSGTYPLPLYTDPAMPTGVDPQVYSDIADSPDGMTKFIVYMHQQADLSAAYEMDRHARGQYVLDSLRNVANQTQANLVSELNKRGVTYESRYIVNAVIVNGNLTLVNYLASRPEVGFIGPNTAVPAPAPVSIDSTVKSPDTIEWNIEKIGANQVWTDFNVTGQGIVLSSIDTGVQWDHPALINQYRGCLNPPTCDQIDHNYNWWDPYHQSPSVPHDADSHGTHTMGTMLGSDDPTEPISATNAIGVAPGARWIACDGFDDNTGNGYYSELLECAEFLLAPWDLSGANPNPDLRPDIVNNSWGDYQAVWWYNQSIYAWRASGIMGVFANGNGGPGCGTVIYPGDSGNVLGVGATDSSDSIAIFSSRGPAAITGITKPDISAPGESIRSSVPGSKYEGGWSGTSMATPHVAGTVALIWSAVPELRGDVQLTSWIIEQTAKGITTNEGCGGDPPDKIPNNTYGWGRINAYAAVSMALATQWDTPWLNVDPILGTVAPGASQDINLSFDTAGLNLGECYVTNLKVEYNDPYVIEQVVPVEVCIGYPMHYIILPIIFK